MKKCICFSLLIIAAVSVSTPSFAADRDGELRFVITAAVASDPSYQNYRRLTHYVAGKLGKKDIFISDLTYDEVDALFMKKEVDVGFLCNCHYERRKSLTKFQPIAAPVISGYGKPKFQVYIIVPKDSAIRTIADMKGKSVDLADRLSTTALYAASVLPGKEETIRSFFRKAIYSGSHDMTIELVANKMVDIGFIDGHIWDYHKSTDPVFTSKTKIIKRSPSFTIPPVVVARETPEDVKKKIRQILLTLQRDVEGREILNKLRIEKFVDIQERDYEDVMHLYSRNKSRM